MGPDDVVGRLFVGIALSDDARAGIAAHLAPFSPLPGRPGPPANWHITLRFLGATTRVQLDRVLAGLSARAPKFSIRFNSLGAFPRPQRATVLWLGIDPEPALGSVAGVAEDVAVGAGMGTEERPFHSHVTLSRVRPPQDTRSLVDSTPPLDLRMAVTEVSVFRSTPHPAGVVYDVIDTVPLG